MPSNVSESLSRCFRFRDRSRGPWGSTRNLVPTSRHAPSATSDLQALGAYQVAPGQFDVPLVPGSPDADVLRRVLAVPGVDEVMVEEAPIEALVAQAYGP